MYLLSNGLLVLPSSHSLTLTSSLLAIKLYGKSWKHVEDHIVTRTSAQIRSHAQKYFQKVEKELGRVPDDEDLMKFEEVLSDDS